MIVCEAVRKIKEAHCNPLSDRYGEPKGCIEMGQRVMQAPNQLFKHAPAQELFRIHTKSARAYLTIQVHVWHATEHKH